VIFLRTGHTHLKNEHFIRNEEGFKFVRCLQVCNSRHLRMIPHSFRESFCPPKKFKFGCVTRNRPTDFLSIQNVPHHELSRYFFNVQMQVVEKTI